MRRYLAVALGGAMLTGCTALGDTFSSTPRQVFPTAGEVTYTINNLSNLPQAAGMANDFCSTMGKVARATEPSQQGETYSVQYTCQ